jgi:hypothetical protein
METNVKSEKDLISSSPEETKAVEATNPETQPLLPPSTETNEQWRRISAQISAFLEQLPIYINNFWKAYKLPIINIALILLAIAAFRVLLSVMDALNDIPLVAAIFKLIGIGYVIWFVVRYLIKASSRQELAVEIQRLKKQIIGETSSQSSEIILKE